MKFDDNSTVSHLQTEFTKSLYNQQEFYQRIPEEAFIYPH